MLRSVGVADESDGAVEDEPDGEADGEALLPVDGSAEVPGCVELGELLGDDEAEGSVLSEVSESSEASDDSVPVCGEELLEVET
ncbi:hypothetical protein SAMN05216207_101735 [Pseudonocardia ammonioxydans]|uniref:Uncharacterized protein n=1 Tax=Pseudonocardia ammonioxydans TaxID=260086 RepID=A0A1I5A8U6_PSUAM|nr:hypothetical protein [Pseudonocardia ammonioxydans]SFN58740.1 hypothetical protein SAMN05216207_101735 [Pseudonocardia ammonioxydans]